VLDDCSIVRIARQFEALCRASRPQPLRSECCALLALASRQTATLTLEIAGDACGIGRTTCIEGHAASVGARLTPIESPFHPEARRRSHRRSGHLPFFKRTILSPSS